MRSSQTKNLCHACMLVSCVFGGLANAQPTLTLVSARDHIPGSFLGDQALCADQDRIYLGSFQGQLFVLARDRANNFPLIETITLPGVIKAVRSDLNNLFVLSSDGTMSTGTLRTFKKSSPLELTHIVQLPGIGAQSFSRIGNQNYVSIGQAEMEVDDTRVYLSPLNEGDVGLVVPIGIMGSLTARPLVYGRVFAPGVTTVYDRRTATVIGSIANPGGQCALVSDKTRIFQTVPGPFGTSIRIYNKSDLSLNRSIGGILAPNTVAGANRPGRDLLLCGTEGGVVQLFDLAPWNSPIISWVNLPIVTGHTNPEDIEIRALWCDGIDNLVFAGSSWGNTSSQSPELPSFFVLEVR